jgi:hypothetical protein
MMRDAQPAPRGGARRQPRASHTAPSTAAKRLQGSLSNSLGGESVDNNRVIEAR